MAQRKSANGLASLFDKRKKEKIELDHSGGGGFPAGIDNGVAQIKTIKLGTYAEGTTNAGKPYFMVRGVAVLPKALDDGTPVEGSQDTLIMEPLYDTPTRKHKTQQEHVDQMLGYLQEFGLDTATCNWSQMESGQLFEALIEAGLYCRYSTWKSKPTKQYPTSRTNINYGGILHDFTAPDSDDDELVDETIDDDDTEEVVDDVVEDDESTDDTETSDGDEDYDALGEAADNGEEEAQARLQELADAYDIDAASLDSWADVAQAVADADSGEDSDDEEAEEIVPTKNEIYKYQPTGAKKPVEVEVVSVNKSKKLCNLKNLDTQKVYKAVSWAKLVK